MPKVLTGRWAIGGSVFLILAVALSLMAADSVAHWTSGRGPASASSATDDYAAGRQHELLFLKAAYDRLDQEIRKQPDAPVARSLRIEQQAVLERLRDAAGPIPHDRLPLALSSLLENAPPPPARAAAAAPVKTLRAAPVGPPPELHIGLRPPPATVDATGLSRDPTLPVVIAVEPRTRRAHAEDKAAEGATGEAKPAARRASHSGDDKGAEGASGETKASVRERAPAAQDGEAPPPRKQARKDKEKKSEQTAESR